MEPQIFTTIKNLKVGKEIIPIATKVVGKLVDGYVILTCSENKEHPFRLSYFLQ